MKKPVPIVRLDDVVTERPVRMIKMDVEGAEPQVLRGARRLLREDRPIVVSELHPTQLDRASGVTAREFLEEARQVGYRAHRLAGGAVGEPIEDVPREAVVSVMLVPEG